MEIWVLLLFVQSSHYLAEETNEMIKHQFQVHL